MGARNTILYAGLVGAAAGYYAFCCWHPAWMDMMGIGNLGQWFLDTRGVLAASDAHALGIAPEAHNPLDVFRQPHTYPDAWFLLAKLHLTRADTVWLGSSIGFLFLIVALSHVRARSLAEAFWSAAVVCAPAAVFGFNRGNIDLLIFSLLSLVVPCLRSSHAAIRWIAVGTIAVATAMKFYPAVAGVMLLVPNRPRREIIAQMVILVGALAIFGISEIDSIRRYAGTVVPAGFFTFGIQAVPHLLGWPEWVAIALTAAILGSAVLVWRRAAPALEIGTTDSTERLNFLLGALVLTSCYFATINYAYRAICTIWMTPFLWTLASNPATPAKLRRYGRYGVALMIVFLWFDAVCCVLLNTVWRVSSEDLNTWVDLLVLVRIPVSILLIGLLLRFVVPFVFDGLRYLRSGGAPAESTAEAIAR